MKRPRNWRPWYAILFRMILLAPLYPFYKAAEWLNRRLP